MNEINDGGPAFPSGGLYATKWEGPRGMFLRDYFAAAALTGIVAHLPEANQEAKLIAPLAYALADTMIAQREKGVSHGLAGLKDPRSI